MKDTPNPHSPIVDTLTLTIPLARLRHPAVGRNRIYTAISAGALQAIRVGRRLAIPIEAMDEWVMRGCPTSLVGDITDVGNRRGAYTRPSPASFAMQLPGPRPSARD